MAPHLLNDPGLSESESESEREGERESGRERERESEKRVRDEWLYRCERDRAVRPRRKADRTPNPPVMVGPRARHTQGP